MAPTADAGPVDPSFTPAVAGGLERLEFRSNGNNTSWSIGLGSNTQATGSFNSTGFDWADDTAYAFKYKINYNGNATFKLLDSHGYVLKTLTWSGMKLGNVLQIHAKGGVDVTFAGQTAAGDVNDRFGVDYVYVDSKPNAFIQGYITFRSPIGNQSASGVTITAGDIDLCPVPPQPDEPVSTAGDGCVGEVTVVIDGVEQTLDNLALVTAVSLDGDTLAVCNGANQTLPQVQCVNVCENFESRAETPQCVEASTGLTNGQLDLDACRPCDLTDLVAPPGVDQDGNPLFYCWEYTNSVVRNPALDPITYPNAPGTEFVPGSTEIQRTRGTLLPHKKAWSSADETEVFNGCYTTTRKLNGRLYSYTTCY